MNRKQVLVVFDIGDILISYNKKEYIRITNNFFKENSVDLKKLKIADNFWNSKLRKLCIEGKMTYEEGIKKYLSIVRRGDLSKKFIDFENKNLTKFMKLVPYSKSVLKELRKMRLRIIALSDYVKSSYTRKKELKTLGIAKYFDNVCTSNSVKASKPSRIAFENAIGNHKNYRKVIFVAHDDDELVGAKEIGMITIGINNNHADYNVKSIKEVPETIKKMIE